MDDLIKTFRKRNIIEILLELRKIQGHISKNSLNLRIVGDKQPRQSIYNGCGLLEKVGLIVVDKESEPNKHFVSLTEKGEEIALKLSYVFDLEKGVVPVLKRDYEEVVRRLTVDNITVESWLAHKIKEFLGD